MQNRALKTLIIGTALVPSLVIALLLGSYLALSRVLDLRDMARERGEAGAQQLAVLAHRALQSRDTDTLQELVTLALEERGVRAAAILDADQRLLVSAGPRSVLVHPELAATTRFGQAADHIEIAQPIFGGARYTSTLVPGASAAEEPIGWVILQHSHAPYLVQSYQSLLVAGLIISATLIGMITFAVFTSARLDRSFALLRQGIARFESGRFDSPIVMPEENELFTLAQQINRMAQTMQRASIELQRTLEQTNRDLRESLETVEVQNIELDLARREALEASRIKSEFLANTSHELRTPLNGIIGFTKLLLKSSLDTRQREYLETIRYSAENLLNIINDILDFSKIEAGKLVLDNVPLNLRDLIEETLSMLAPSAFEKRLDLVLLYDNDVPADLVGDPLRLRQILTNLISNGIKFTNSGHIAVRVSLSGAPGPRAPIKISVTDTGIGLSDAQQKQLFRAFAQADASTSRLFGGTGLGLAISKKLIEQMGGEIGVDSQLGQGSTFWFSVRLPVQANPLRQRSFDLLKGRRILLYDNSPLSQLALRQLLESWDVVVITLDTPQQLALAAPADAAVISLNAAELAADCTDEIAVREEPQLILIPALTSNNRDEPGRRLVTKPIGHLEFYDALCTLLEPSVQPLPATSARHLRRSLQVLAVDDNIANLKLLAIMLEELGAQATVASSGRQALGLCDQRPFDLIFMDLQMPELSGAQVTQLIREGNSPNRNTRIVALTAHLLAEEQRQLLSQGFDLCLTKPLTDEQLQRLLRQISESDADHNERDRLFGDRTPPAGQRGPVDITLCLQRAQQKPDLAAEMLESVLSELRATRQQITAAAEAEDYEQLLDLVHKLHGATCYTGLPHLQKAAYDLEHCLKQSPHTSQQCAEVHAALNAAIDTLLVWYENHDTAMLFEDQPV